MKMLKKYKTILILLIVLIITSFYKPLTLYLFPNLDIYQRKLIEEGLQAITVLIFITAMKLWYSVGGLTKISKKSMLIMLPIIILSFIPLYNGVKTYKVSNILMVMVFSLFIGLSEELACRGVILPALMHKGKTTSIILSSIIFGSLHLMNLFKGAGFEDTIIQMIFATCFGLTMAVVRYKTELILPQIFVHALWDFNSKIAKSDNVSEGYEIIFFISMALVILWGVLLTLRELKNDKVQNLTVN
jgi:membrane protease YdiL (CAAX protease family)